MRIRSLLILFLLAACSEPPSAPQALSVAELLGGGDTAGFRRAMDAREFSFPADHNLHPGFRNEWWYFTGNLETDAGRRFAYQVTFFANALNGDTQTTNGGASPWRSDRIWMAHVALTDVQGGEHRAEERFSRENPGLAGAGLTPFRVWLNDWQLRGDGNDFPWSLEIEAGDFSLSLVLNADKQPVLQGDAGLSRKSDAPGNASYYYSMTRLPTAGTVSIPEGRFTVSGQSWLDREWSTSVLAADQSGWDWFSLQFDNGEELMYYQLRDMQGNAHPFSAGNLTDRAARQIAISPQDIELQELETWNSPDGVSYTTAWLLRYRERDILIRAVLEDQWMDLSVPYWEGAVDVIDAGSGEVRGRGFLEMVRSL